MYALLANLVLLLHLTVIVIGAFGAILVHWRKWFAFIQIPLAIWDIFVEVAGVVCPLTPLENYFRARAGQAPYAGDFIDHYITSVIYPAGLTRGMQIALGVAVLVLNVVIYWHVITKHRGMGPEHKTR